MTLLTGRIGGSGVYAHALFGALNERHDIRVEAIAARPGGGLSTLRWMVAGGRARVLETRSSVLHCPAFLAPFDSPVPVVLTIHDLSLDRMPSGHPLEWRLYYRFLLPRLARKASMILTPTETTRRDVIDAFGIPSDRVVAVPSGIDGRFSEVEQRDRSMPSPQPLIAFAGPPIGRKNLDIVLRVMVAAPPESALSKARLEITGALADDFPHYRELILHNGLSGRVDWLGKLPFEDIPSVYSRADVLVYPSFLEGFGFPPLEAMATGTPVVASNVSCLPEVLADAALLVDPTNDVAFASAIESVFTNRELRLRLVEAGTARARMYTWARCAEMTAAVYKQVAGASRPVAEAQ
jgi:glycosyltransferase involved in cell wall biosynthesis